MVRFLDVQGSNAFWFPKDIAPGPGAWAEAEALQFLAERKVSASRHSVKSGLEVGWGGLGVGVEGWGGIGGWGIISGSSPRWFSVLGNAETLGAYGRMLWQVVGVT